MEVSFENRRSAAYDREDDVWIGGEWDNATVRSDITLELYMEMDVATGDIVDTELIRSEYVVG